jgi:DNA mismatch repair protein MutL
MPKINILSEDTANKIAAGEVIERPSSIVKELVENSIDAAARRIHVDLEGGGKSLVRVTDDGCGMSYEDALLCLERHATSKISCAADLDAMTTFGFRGEAIPSIAAVSKMELVTREYDSISGTRVVIEGGVLRNVSETGSPPGTQVTVRQLFYNTPARRKFMKSSATELGHVINMLQRQALAHPHINFRLTSNGKETLNLPPAASTADRLALVWGSEYADNLAHGSAGTEGLIVSGYFGTPALTRANRDHQFFFLNRRPVTNRLLSQALAEAYRGIVMSDRFPVAFVFVEIDPHLVDVNVHPTKREVRFADPNGVIGALKDAVRDAFGRRPHFPAGESRPRMTEPSPTRSKNDSLFQSIRFDEGTLATVLPAIDEEQPVDRMPVHPVTLPTADFSAISSELRLIGQVFNSYLLCTDGRDLLILDQHALHERILYDEIVRQSNPAGGGEAATQQMLIPITIELPPDRAEVLSAYFDLFARIGIELQPFGSRTFAVTAISRTHSESRVGEIVRDGVDELYLGLKLRAPREILQRLMTISACKNSIKSGDPLTEREAEMLLEGLKRLAPPPTCLHGRPLVLRLSESQIARAFGRKG